MNVDLYCTQCSHIIETICTNLDEYQHSLHKSEHDDVICNQCSASAHVVIRCYIPRDTIAKQMNMQSQSQEQDDYESFALSSAITRRHAG